MENLESFFELSNYDNKNITNKGEKEIPQEALNKIENEGVTLEFLNEMKVPVFKYRTQITIHGYFPELTKHYLGGYKNLFQNKNQSIGVKWQVVDFKKKERIYKTITGYLQDWNLQHNSTYFNIYKTSKRFDDKETYKTLLADAKNEISHINKELFFGNCEVYLSKSLWGGYFLVTSINIGACLESNVIPIIENICQDDINTIQAKLDLDAEKYRLECEAREAKYKLEAQQEQERKLPLLNAAKEVLINAGYKHVEKKPIFEGLEALHISVDTKENTFSFYSCKYTKEPRSKKFSKSKSLLSHNFEFDFSTWQSTKEKISATIFNGWVKEVIKPIQEVKPVVLTENVNVQIVDYSEKALAIFGDTKAIKEQLKQIGARFNPYLNNNGTKSAGWILPKTSESKLSFINN